MFYVRFTFSTLIQHFFNQGVSVVTDRTHLNKFDLTFESDQTKNMSVMIITTLFTTTWYFDEVSFKDNQNNNLLQP